MKAFSILMAGAALVAAIVGITKLTPTKIERLQENVVTSTQELARFTSSGEKIMAMVGQPTSFGATEAQAKLRDAQDGLSNRRQSRQTQATIAFGLAGFFVLLSVIGFSSNSLGARFPPQQSGPQTSLSPPPPTAHRYFIFMNESVQGPFEKSALIAMRGFGNINNSTPCCPEGSETWTDLTAILDQ
jgi:hypothetical protein